MKERWAKEIQKRNTETQKKVARKNHLEQMKERWTKEVQKRNVEYLEKKRQQGIKKASPALSVCTESVSSEGVDAITETIQSFVFKFQDEQCPASVFPVGRSYWLTADARVRVGLSFWNSESPVKETLQAGTRVYVDKFDQVEMYDSGRIVDRAYITSPLRGWISVKQTRNQMLLSKTDPKSTMV